jgi:thiamine transport system ATP-binding protein
MMFLEIDDLELQLNAWRLRVSLTLRQGECLALIGPSGAGKSTLLSLIAGFEEPRRGSIQINGRAIDHLDPASRPVTMMFQENNLFNHLSLYDNVALGCHPGLKLNASHKVRIEQAMVATELTQIASRLPAEVSGGERQRAALARCLVQQRPLLLLDEPFANLDPRLRHEMHSLVDDLRRANGLTVVIVTHLPDEISRIAERTVFIHDGRVLEHGPTAELLARPRTAELIHYLKFTPQP